MIQVGLKWPNDILLDQKKGGGILIEMVRAPEGDWVALIGVGLNVSVRSFPPDIAPTAASLRQESVAPEAMITLAERIALCLQQWGERGRSEGYPAILSAWRAYDRMAGWIFHTEIDGTPVSGGAEGIDEYGALLLRLPDGQLVAITSASSLQDDGVME
jgi:BirA family biotin operon repressor/biotin-[acetyl-CoA-carboxylase] ligase